MLFDVGMENNMEGRSCSWVLGHPGCFAYGKDSAAALAATADAIRRYAAWIEAHGAKGWLEIDDLEIRLLETWDVYDINDDYDRVEQGYSVNAWFQHDWKPLTDQDVERGLKLLTWSRQDLLEAVHGLTPEVLNAAFPGERWSISGILRHIGGAEWWYLHRLGLAFPRERVPDDPFDRLQMVRARLLEVLPQLSGSRLVMGVDGEFWSPRKLLRRAVWHERDHIWHILSLLQQPR